jgi:hypothetical protein
MSNIQRWFLIIAMWTGILFVIFAFYWMAVRPGHIRQMCAGNARKVCEGTKSSLPSMLEINRAVYSECLKSHGIDK